MHHHIRVLVDNSSSIMLSKKRIKELAFQEYAFISEELTEFHYSQVKQDVRIVCSCKEENLTIYPFHVKGIDPVIDVYLMPEEVTSADKFYATANMIANICYPYLYFP